MLNLQFESPKTVTTPFIPIQAVQTHAFSAWLDTQPTAVQKWLKSIDYRAASGKIALLGDAEGHLIRVVLGVKDELDFWAFAAAAHALPPGHYRIEDYAGVEASLAILAWGLEGYRYAAYKNQEEAPQATAVLQIDTDPEFAEGSELAEIEALLSSIVFARDLINAPPADLMPAQLAQAAVALAEEQDATVEVIEGEALLDANYPMVYAVGKGSQAVPCFIEMEWGEPHHPRVVLIGKGVCFDTGGLDMKNSAGMALMKKDMGGAAIVLALARLVMLQRLPIRLQVLIPAVENAVSGNAYHPSDILVARNGDAVEITNTDAEGRLVVADALVRASEGTPDLIIDIATLTGAARVALGPSLPGVFSNQQAVADALLNIASAVHEPCWQLPLYRPYNDFLKSEVADLCNAAAVPYAGAITAALFLNHFVNKNVPWLHLDVMAWNIKAAPGRPLGGEATGLRAVFAFLKNRYAATKVEC